MSLSLYGSYHLSRIGLLETTEQLPTLTRGKRRCAYRLPQRGIWQTGSCNDYATNTRFREGEEVSEDKQNKKGLGGLGSALGNVTGQGGQVAQGVQDTAVQATQQAQDPAGRAAQQANTTEQPTQQTGGGQEAAGQLSEPTSAASQKAEELGVDLAQVEGSGPGGRITLQDVMNATKQG